MSSEETTQKDVLIKTDPFYLKVVEGAGEGVYLYDNTYRVIFIDLKSKYFEELLEGKFNIPLSGTVVEGNNVGVKYIITIEVDKYKELVMKYSYADEDLPELFVSEVHVLGNVSKDRDSVTTKDGNVIKSMMLTEPLSGLLLECEDGKPDTRYILYKYKGSLHFKDLQIDIVRNNSIITISNYFEELITHVLVEDLLEDNEESTVKTDEYVKEIHEMTEVKDPTKNMLTAEEARRLSNANLFSIFTHLNDKVSIAIDEGKRYITIKPNTTIPTEVKDTVLKTLREDLGYNVGVSVSGEISISW